MAIVDCNNALDCSAIGVDPRRKEWLLLIAMNKTA